MLLPGLKSWEPKGKLCEEEETMGRKTGGAGWKEGWTGWKGFEAGGKGRRAGAPAG